MKPLATPELEIMAQLYVANLYPGDVVFDWEPGLSAYRRFIPKALAKRHLCLVPVAEGEWHVAATFEVPPQPEPEIERDYKRIPCRCGAAWFACPCVATLDIELMDDEDAAAVTP